jgi:hypothetical protein
MRDNSKILITAAGGKIGQGFRSLPSGWRVLIAVWGRVLTISTLTSVANTDLRS